MIVIQLAGGLGNQMFQYALYLQLKSLGKTVKIDDQAGFVQDEQREAMLGLFGIDYERATPEELTKMLDSSPQLWHKVRRKLCGRKKKSYLEEDRRFQPKILEWDDIYLDGYWQTEKYFADVTGKVREAFDLDRLLAHMEQIAGENPRAVIGRWYDKITAIESVSVHIRRGDYLLPKNETLYGGICTESYYEKAMERMRQKYPGCRFYLFTNDKEWAKRWIADLADAEIVDMECFGALRDYAEFALMGGCRHNILANSSFSWWASYLNKNPEKTVLAPEQWLNGWDCTDIYRDDMEKVHV